MYCKYGLIAEKLKSSPQAIYRRHHFLWFGYTKPTKNWTVLKLSWWISSFCSNVAPTCVTDSDYTFSIFKLFLIITEYLCDRLLRISFFVVVKIPFFFPLSCHQLIYSLPNPFQLFGFPTIRLWAYLMKVIPDTRRTHWI
jgi:hypothetical protein